MPLVDQWTRNSTASGLSRSVTVGAAVPVGRVLAVAVSVNNNIATVDVSDSKGNVYTLLKRFNNGGTVTTALFACRVTTALLTSDTMDIDLSATASRCGVVVGVFDDVVLPIFSPGSASAAPTSAAPTTTTFPFSVTKALVLSAVGYTSAGAPATPNSNTLVGSVVTSAGSTDRGVGLFYEYDTDGTAQGRATLGSSVACVILGAALDATPPPPPVGGGIGQVVVSGVPVDFSSAGEVVGGVLVPFSGGGVVVGGAVVPFA